ncbi:MAG: hypothetical protein HDR05_12470 [Lachnospiraceae bacterium]|nr:hypothetical protein [Lachnospiraceae bacterium]
MNKTHQHANRLKRLAIYILSLMLVFSSLSISAYADNADGGGQGAASSTNAGGASENKCGFRMYVVDYNGNLKSKVIDLVYTDPSADMSLSTTRIGGGSVSLPSSVYTMPSDMPRPYYHSGSFIGNGQAVKKWMRTKGNDGQQNIITLIEKYLGSNVAELFLDQSEEYYCVLEPIAWHNIYLSNDKSSNSGVCFYGTFYNWMQLYSKLGLSNGGFTRTLDNNVLGRCLTFEKDQTNLGLTMPTSGGLLDINTVGSQAFGIQVYSNKDMEGTHTWDYVLGDTPGPAPKSSGKMFIVKNYRTEIKENQYTDDGCFTRELTDSTIQIEDEETYVVVGWKITNTKGTPDSINWNPPGSVAEQGKRPTTVTIKKPSTTLYVLLERAKLEPEEILDADYILKESQIARAISLKTTDNDMPILQDYVFNWKFGKLNKCAGHHISGSHNDDCEEDCDKDHGHTEYCEFTLQDRNWLFKLLNENREAYPKNLAFNDFWVDYTNEKAEERTTLEDGTVEVEDRDYKTVLHRGSDSLTIAQWKNENEALDSLEDFNTANSKSPTRKKADYKESINVSLVDSLEEEDLITTSKGSLGCDLEDEAALDNPLSVDVGILYETYSGAQNGGKLNNEIDNSEMLTIGSAGNKIMSGRMVESGLSFSFHPYIKMRYDTMNGDGAVTKDNEIFILSEYLRSLSLNDYAEIEWNKKTLPNMILSSPQWSTHKTPVSEWGRDSLLPGGAQMILGIRNQDRQEVIARTYQCILIEDGKEQVDKTWQSIDGFTKESALQVHKGYTQSIINGLENLSVEQWQHKDPNSDPFKGIKVYNEANISSLQNTNDGKASYEDKYYFKDERGIAQSGCLDVNEGNTSTEYYTFSSDTSGNILMNGSVILTKNQGVESLTGKALAINSRTLVVSKLVDAIERNTGNDPEAKWIADGAWYNEAFDGITVAISTTVLKTGYIDPFERVSILDPKLDTKTKTKGDMFSSYMVGQIKMRDYSTVYGMVNMIGEFKGSPILMKDMDRLYYTKKFYLSNITVQDLH